MKISVQTRVAKGEQSRPITIQVKKYTHIPITNTLLVIRDGKMGVTLKGTETHEYLEIYKPISLLMCETEESETLTVLIYLGEFALPQTFVLDGLPTKYEQELEDNIFIVDYQFYLDNCKITGEKPLSLYKYFKNSVRGENAGSNSILFYEGKEYNYDQQNELYEKVDSENKSINVN